MRIVIVNTKGGCGKTLLATQLACYYASIGKSVAICDHDSQRSSKDWIQARPKKLTKITSVVASHSKPPSIDSEIIIHDMPAGYDIRELLVDVPGVEKILIPLLPSPTDLRVLWRFCMMLSYSGLLETNIDMGFVINRYRAGSQFNETMMRFLERMEIPLIGKVRDTQNYIHATNRGLGIFDIPGNKTKVDRESWQPIIDWLEGVGQESFAQLLMEDIVEKQMALV
jgi:chromosome partitioning protein